MMTTSSRCYGTSPREGRRVWRRVCALSCPTCARRRNSGESMWHCSLKRRSRTTTTARRCTTSKTSRTFAPCRWRIWRTRTCSFSYLSSLFVPTFLHCLFLGPKVVCWMGYSVHLFKTTCMIVHTPTSHVVSLETPTRSMVLGIVVAPYQHINFPFNTLVIRWHCLFVLLFRKVKRRHKPNPIQYPLHPLHSISCTYLLWG